MKNNRRKARNHAAPAQTISALIEKPNIWSDWFASRWIGPLSWVQMAALLMRDTRPEQIVDRLAPLLDRTREKVEANCRRWASEGPDERRIELTYASYREHFLDALYDDFERFLKTLEGNRDLEWLDLTFSMPKSASLMAQLGGDKRVLVAQDAAVKATMAYLQKHFAEARDWPREGAWR